MKIVADAGIPHLAEGFAGLGEVVCVDGRAIDRDHVKDAGALVVRSLTRVDRRLLDGSRVRFVGTVTAGLDHVDEAYLAARGIRLSSAAGANANAVAEYVLTALHSVTAAEAEATRVEPTVGVIGFGNVGRRVVRYLRELGRKVVVCDPPLARRLAAGTFVETGPLADLVQSEDFVDLDRLLTVSRVVSLHVPLSHEGLDPTHHLLDAARLASLRERTLLLNTSRGAVVDNAALEEIGPRRSLSVVLDVWEHEPHLRWSLLGPGELLRFATAHVAGHSRDARAAVMRTIHVALCEYLGRSPSWESTQRVDRQPLPVNLGNVRSTSAAFASCLSAACGLSEQDRRLRDLADLPIGERARAFDALRGKKVERLEFRHHHIDLEKGRVAHGVNRALLRRSLGKVGFRVASSAREQRRGLLGEGECGRQPG